MTSQSRQSKPEEVVMAGDGGRVPDVSEDCPDCWEGRPKWAGTMLAPPCPTCDGSGKRSPQSEDHEDDDPAMPYPHGMPWFEDAKEAAYKLGALDPRTGLDARHDAVQALLGVLNDIGGGNPWNFNVITEAAEDAWDAAIVAYLSHADPASVLAALLAESPEATVAAIEALLTSDEAVSAYRRAYLTSPPHGVKHDHAARMEHERAGMRAAARSLLSKAPKEDGDA